MLVGGAIAGAILLPFVLLRLFASGLPVIKQSDLDRAIERWTRSDVDDYRLTVVLGGRQTGELQVEVRRGAATSLVRNGVAVPQPRAWLPWTVPGMFETLQTDFDNAARADEKFGGAEVVMRCEFDESLGYPKRYLHQILGRHGDLEWTVTRFERIAPEPR